jgi:AcrR family transcriptional regulator
MSRQEFMPMVNINLERRAEIGREKRGRTRLQLMTAAKALFSKRPWESVTIDELVQDAGVAKGTFYSHFNDLEELAAAVANELIDAFDAMIQPQRLSISDPLLRIAFGCDAFLRQSLSDRSWALLATRMARSHPTVGLLVRGRLSDDLRDALDKSPQAGLTPELGVEVIIGVVLQVAAAIGEGRFDDRVRPEAIRCVLAAIGVGRRDAASIVARLARVRGSVPRGMLKDGSPAGGSSSAAESA